MVMASLEGTITLAQESRFQMTDDEGASHLFLLGPHAAAEPAQLAALAASQARLRVRYQEGENVLGAIAQRIDLVSDAERKP